MVCWVGALATMALQPHLPAADQPYADAAVYAFVIIGMASFAFGPWQSEASLEPPKCPRWMIPNGDGTFAPPAWIFLLMTAFAALVMTYYAITWKRFSRHVLDKIRSGQATYMSGTQLTHWGQLNAMSATQLDYNSLFVVVMIAFTLFTAAPLILVGFNCF
jgi:hypothetical protein